MKEQIEITRIMKEKLDGCPNCGGDFRQNSTYKFKCVECGNAYSVQTKNERIVFGTLVVAIIFSVVFLIGFILGKG